MAFCKMNSCCFCLNLRLGCIIIGVLGILMSFLRPVPGHQGYISNFSLLATGSALSLTAAVCLISGAAWKAGNVKTRTILLIVYIICEASSAIIYFIGAILVFKDFSYLYQLNTYYIDTIVVIEVIAAAAILLYVALDVYFFIVVVNFVRLLEMVEIGDSA